jgi:hypothetical protein
MLGDSAKRLQKKTLELAEREGMSGEDKIRLNTSIELLSMVMKNFYEIASGEGKGDA